MGKSWQFQPYDTSQVEYLVRSLKIAPVIAQLLVSRGITDPRLADQFLAGESADLGKVVVAVGDHALERGSGNQPATRLHPGFTLGDRAVVAHGELKSLPPKSGDGFRWAPLETSVA